jgi:hypothetical protein
MIAGSHARRGWGLAGAICVAAALAAGQGGCSGSGGGTATSEITEKVTIPLGAIASNLSGAAGQTQFFGFTLALPPDEGITGWTVDLLSTLSTVTVTLPSPGIRSLARALASIVNVSLGVSHALPAGTACDDSVAYRTFSVTVDAALRPTSADPAAWTSSTQSLSTRAGGLFTYCARVTFPVDAIVTVEKLVVDVTRRCDQAPGDFAGSWVGEYECHAVTCSSFTDAGPITLQIAYDAAARRWSYTDEGGATYQGSACGNLFHFVRNDPGESERGTFTLNADRTATKTSRYFSTATPACYGECTDHLHRP